MCWENVTLSRFPLAQPTRRRRRRRERRVNIKTEASSKKEVEESKENFNIKIKKLNQMRKLELSFLHFNFHHWH